MPGDLALTKNEQTGERELRRVLALWGDPHGDLLVLAVISDDGTHETISVTVEQPFYVAGRGWAEAQQHEWPGSVAGCEDRSNRSDPCMGPTP